MVRFADHLAQGEIRLPRIDNLNVAMTTLGDVGAMGPLDRDITGLHPDKEPRGPFDCQALVDRGQTGPISYPMLWNHDINHEQQMTVTPDSQGIVRPGMQDQAVLTWNGYESDNRSVAGATRLHINRDFGTASGSIGACLTPVKSIGGRAWPSFQVDCPEPEVGEKAIALWLNTTLGLIGRWWVSARQQSGRLIMNISTIPNIPVIDLGQLSRQQVAAMANLFDKNSDQKLEPAWRADQDAVRLAMDKELLIGILALPDKVWEPLGVIRSHWCLDSSVRGQKLVN